MTEIEAKRKELEEKAIIHNNFTPIDNFNLGVEMARRYILDKIRYIIQKLKDNEFDEGGINNDHELCIDKYRLIAELEKSLGEKI